jgi:murein hydrolase activator
MTALWNTILCVTVTATTILPGTVSGEESDLVRRLDSQKAMLRQLEGDLGQARADAITIRSTERDAAQNYVETQNRVGLIEHSLRQLTQAESLLVVDIKAARSMRSRITQQVGTRTSVMSRRVRTLYMQGRRQPYQRAVLASSLAHWMAARQYMATLTRRDQIDIRHLVADRVAIDSLTTIYTEQQTTLDTLFARRTRQRSELLTAREDAKVFLHRVRRDRQLAERATKELEAQKQDSQERIADYLEQFEEQISQIDEEGMIGGVSVAAPVDFVSEKGRLPWPVDGEVVARFGRQRDAETRTWTRNRGIDIGTPAGTSVRAVAPGRVVKIDWYRGYGTFVIVAHGQNYYTLYAHLGALNVRLDDYMRRGQVIGNSESGDGMESPRIHFELLAGHEAMNPIDWLVADQDDPL